MFPIFRLIGQIVLLRRENSRFFGEHYLAHRMQKPIQKLYFLDSFNPNDGCWIRWTRKFCYFNYQFQNMYIYDTFWWQQYIYYKYSNIPNKQVLVYQVLESKQRRSCKTCFNSSKKVRIFSFGIGYKIRWYTYDSENFPSLLICLKNMQILSLQPWIFKSFSRSLG